MKKFLKYFFLILIIAFVGIQFIPTKRNTSLTASPSDFLKVYQSPDKVSSLLRTSCYDCHSNTTEYPWYGSIQPMAWMLEDHIVKGKEALNLSEFGNLSKRMQRVRLTTMISEIRDDEMPLSSYLLMHQDASLSDQDKTELIEYLDSLLSDI